MFSKFLSSANPGVAPSPPPAPLQPQRPLRTVSVIAEGITIKGNVRGEGEVQIDGVVRGDVKVSRLSVGETGLIEGAVIAEAVECRGRIVGSITARQVRLYGSSHVDGDITHDQLAMETGAFFQGRSLKFQRQQGADQPGSPSTDAGAPEPL